MLEVTGQISHIFRIFRKIYKFVKKCFIFIWKKVLQNERPAVVAPWVKIKDRPKIKMGGYDLEFHLEFFGRFLWIYALFNNNFNKQYKCYRCGFYRRLLCSKQFSDIILFFKDFSELRFFQVSTCEQKNFYYI